MDERWLIHFQDLYLSVFRWLLGISIGSAFGFALALLSTVGFKGNRWFLRSLDFLRAVPIIGLLPVVQMNIGINEYGKIGLISWAVVFPVYLSVRTASRRELPDAENLLRAARVEGAHYQRVYIWPKLAAGLIHGIEVGIGIGWLALVAAEWVGTYTTGFWSGGLGYRLLIGYQNNNWSQVHFTLAEFGVLGLTTAFVWRRFVNIFCSLMSGFDPQRQMARGQE